MTILKFCAAVPVLAVTLTACATGECDPSQGGFIRGIGCSASGSYGERQEQKQAALQQEQQRKSELQTEVERTSQEKAAVRSQREAAERKYASLQNDLDAMEAKLAKSKTENKDLEERLAALQAETVLAKTDTSASDAERQKQLRLLQEQKDTLEDEIDQALTR
ncbi:MAG: hypothetical protein IPM60_02865 [Rhodospirillales bacterium]|nr:hypothetical protein [Rhodospirillales bacterium]